MNRVALNNQELQSFIGMSETQISKKGRKFVINKLNSMGMKNVDLAGRGKKAIYTFDIPSDYYKILVVPISYSPIAVDCMDILMAGNVKGELVLFHTEMLKEIAIKHDAEYTAVETTFHRIKRHLNECGLLWNGKKKSHRVKLDDQWITGYKALHYDQEAKKIWRRTYER